VCLFASEQHMSNREAWRVEAVLHAYFEESPYSDEDE
jgi:hypothetical protein